MFSPSRSIAEFTTVSPPGLMRSDQTTGYTDQNSFITVTWTPSPSQQGAHILCFTATDNTGYVEFLHTYASNVLNAVVSHSYIK